MARTLVVAVLARTIHEWASFCNGRRLRVALSRVQADAEDGSGVNGVVGGTGGRMARGAWVGGDTSGATMRGNALFRWTPRRARARDASMWGRRDGSAGNAGRSGGPSARPAPRW